MASTKVKYTGPLTEGVELGSTGQVFVPGEAVEVSDELAADLLVRDDFAPSGEAAKAIAAKLEPVVVMASDDKLRAQDPKVPGEPAAVPPELVELEAHDAAATPKDGE